MALRFRQTFTLFPGVRINIAKGGISASIGVPGASINIGRQGVRATVGAPGTGMSYSTLVVPAGQARSILSPQSGPVPSGLPDALNPAFRNRPASARTYMPEYEMSEIVSASVESLSSSSLIPLRDLIAKAREQRSQVKADIKEARDEAARQQGELARRKGSLFRWFYRNRIVELDALIPVSRAEIERLMDWEENTRIAVAFEAGDAANRAYSVLVRAFDALKQSARTWDVTSDRTTNRFLERTLASRSVLRHPALLEFSSTDLIQFAGRAMRFENVNGDDILIYPGLALMPRADGLFALIDIRDLSVEYEGSRFEEADTVPNDSVVLGHTWAKVNKDGSPDRRFKGNYQIPVCLYGRIAFFSETGVAEEYMISNTKAALTFVESLHSYQKALAEQDMIQDEGSGGD